MRENIYRATVVAFDAATGCITCTIPQLYGTQVMTIPPAVIAQSEIPRIPSVQAGDEVYVFYDGGEDRLPLWFFGVERRTIFPSFTPPPNPRVNDVWLDVS